MTVDGLILGCPKCGARNRVRLERYQQPARCGKCGKDLPHPTAPIELDDSNFEDVVKLASVPVVVDFWAPWCGPCKSFTPTFQKFARASAGRVLAVKVNVDEAPETAARHGIRSIPTVSLFKDGAEVSRQVGTVPMRVLEQMTGIPAGG